MFRKVAPWYAKRFGPCHEFNKRVVQVSTKAEFHDALENYTRWRQQFLDGNGELQPRFRPPPLVASDRSSINASCRSPPRPNSTMHWKITPAGGSNFSMGTANCSRASVRRRWWRPIGVQ